MNFKKILFLVSCFSINLILFAQNKNSKFQTLPTIYSNPVSSDMQTEEKDLYPKVKSFKMGYSKEFKAQKDSANNGTLSGNFIPKSNKTAADDPIMVSGFNGNPFDWGIPLDNDMTVGNNGKILSAVNTNVSVFSPTGTSLSNKSLGQFAQSLGINGSKFDPKVTYDPIRDRFIIVFLNGSSSTSSKVIVGFSKTNDPAGAWWLYSFTGNVTGNVWTDFPQIGISNQELFITGNLFDNNDAGQGSAVWILPLDQGIAGQTLNITPTFSQYFSLHPVEGGLNMYGPTFYLISSSSGSGSEITLHPIVTTAGSRFLPSVEMTAGFNYVTPSDAPQPSVTNKLNTNDTRVQSSYFENNQINYVLNTSFSSKACVYYGTIWVDSTNNYIFSSADSRYLFDSQYHIAFPSVAYGGCGSSLENSSIVFADYTSAAEYPGVGAFSTDTNQNNSAFVLLKEGLSSLQYGDPSRWGDYSGIANKHNEPGIAWAAGTYCDNSGSYRTFIAQIKNPNCSHVTSVETKIIDENANVFPNPVRDIMHFEFDLKEMDNLRISLIDLQGKEVALISEDRFKAGKLTIQFNSMALNSGTYILKVQGKSTDINKKIIINH